jgi:hypothetical protein
MRESKWDVTSLAGKTAQLEVVDQSDSAVWGHIGVDNIALRDMVTPLAKQRDWGSMALAAIGAGHGSAQLVPPPQHSVFGAPGWAQLGACRN